MSYFDSLVDAIACNSRAELGKDLPNGRTEVNYFSAVGSEAWVGSGKALVFFV